MPQKQTLMENPIKILVLNNEVEATLFDQILQDRNIPFLIRSFHDSAYDGLWQNQAGWGHLMAPPEYKEEILRLYSEMLNASFDESQDGEQ